LYLGKLWRKNCHVLDISKGNFCIAGDTWSAPRAWFDDGFISTMRVDDAAIDSLAAGFSVETMDGRRTDG
jgi:hypothetical protein